MDLNELPTAAWIMDMIIGAAALVLFLFLAIGWIMGGVPSRDKSFDERKAGREATSGQLTLSLTASSIFLAASFVVLQLGRSGENEISDAAVTQVLMAAIAFAASSVIAVWNAALIVPLSKDYDVSLNAFTNVFSAMALFSLLAGAGFFTVALFLI